MEKTGNQSKQCQLVSKSSESMVSCFVRSLVYLRTLGLKENSRQNMGKCTIELAPGKACKERKSLSCFWLGLELMQGSRIIAPSLNSSSKAIWQELPFRKHQSLHITTLLVDPCPLLSDRVQVQITEDPDTTKPASSPASNANPVEQM